MNIDLFSLTKTRLAGGDFTPPPDRQRQIDALQLIRSARVGPATFHRLMTEYGEAAAAIRALPEIAAAAGVRDYAPCPPGVAQAEWNAGTKSGAQLLVYGAPNYPCSLMGLPDAPAVLWAQGRLDLLARPMVALVGARNASSLGLRMARKLAEGLAQAGVVVVSGLARGIDAAAHGGALTGGTIAVLAGGIGVIYPAENAKLADKIARQGLCLSEQPPGLAPQARHFPIRNRIVSGLSQAVIVVEAAARSGSLLTARDAADQGRDVMAVPGHPFDARTAGCNMLLRDGATLIRGVDDVLEALSPLLGQSGWATPQAAPSPPVPEENGRPPTITAPDELSTRILECLGPSPLPEDLLIRDLGVPPDRMAAALLTLELEGRVQRHPGGLLTLG